MFHSYFSNFAFTEIMSRAISSILLFCALAKADRAASRVVIQLFIGSQSIVNINTRNIIVYNLLYFEIPNLFVNNPWLHNKFSDPPTDRKVSDTRCNTLNYEQNQHFLRNGSTYFKHMKSRNN